MAHDRAMRQAMHTPVPLLTSNKRQLLWFVKMEDGSVAGTLARPNSMAIITDSDEFIDSMISVCELPHIRFLMSCPEDIEFPLFGILSILLVVKMSKCDTITSYQVHSKLFRIFNECLDPKKYPRLHSHILARYVGR